MKTRDGSAAYRALRECERAPEPIRDEFWRAVRKRNEAITALEVKAALEADPDEPILMGPPIYLPPPVIWDERWERKASRQRQREAFRRRGVVTKSIADEIDAMMRIEPAEYVEAMTGEVVGYGRKIHCPLPGHDERTPSFHVFPDAEKGWRCFGCNRRGRIYDLAAEVWGLRLPGQFREIHDRLWERFA